MCYLFNSRATYSFLSYELSAKLNVTLESLNDVYIIVVVGGELDFIYHMYKNYNLEISGEIFKVDFLPMGIKSFFVVIGMDWLGPN